MISKTCSRPDLPLSHSMNLVKERYFILCLIIEEYLFIWIYISQHYSFKLLHSVALHCDIGVTLTIFSTICTASKSVILEAHLKK